MVLRVWRWLLWGFLLGLVPLACGVGIRFYEAQKWPSLGELLGSGQGLLTAVAWLGAALRELHFTPEFRQKSRDFITWAALIFALFAAVSYGVVTAQLLETSTPQTSAQATQVGWLSVVILGFAAVWCCAATVIATPPPRKDK